MQSVRFTLPILHSLHEELINIREKPLPLEDSSELMKLASEIELKDISFSYKNSSSVLKGIDMKIPAGSCVGLIGESGAGKSTLLDLLLGLNQPSTGEILIDGKRIQDNLRSWQRGIGYVPQEVFLTDDTLKRNIAFGLKDEDIDDEKVKSAIKLAKLDSFVAELQDGEDSSVGERGVRISGGQKQRIGIARALYENPSVLILDEATSSLDSATEIEVMSSIKELIGTKTIIIVAHRISTMADSNFLYRIENGTIGKKLFYKDIV
jgi:ABC-type multidrug transport system fused ATPase/permease subunit